MFCHLVPFVKLVAQPSESLIRVGCPTECFPLKMAYAIHARVSSSWNFILSGNPFLDGAVIKRLHSTSKWGRRVIATQPNLGGRPDYLSRMEWPNSNQIRDYSIHRVTRQMN